MATVKEIFDFIDSFAPVSSKMDFDNVGILTGHVEAGVSKVLVALDITDSVIDEAKELEADLIVSHHPLFFSLKSVTDGDAAGRKVMRLIEEGIAAVCMHTNLDAAFGGVNDCLASAVGIIAPEMLGIDGRYEDGRPYSIGRYGCLEEEMTFSEYLRFVKRRLHANGLRYVSSGRKVKKVAVLGGSGGSELQLAIENGCDTFITADIKYNVFIDAKEAGINLIDGDHFCTENVVIKPLSDKIAERFTDIGVFVSKRHIQTAQFF